MDQLIPIINELQDTYSKLNMPFIDLPQIVIIGAQSAGKSSVLENIVRQEFLPRGTGIVTRCPLMLHLVHDPDASKGTRGRFLHTGDKDYYDFNDIKEEIIRQTDILAGSEKNISDQPITLKIYSHEFPNLTLIDLPGLTKVAVESQPKDIDVQIKNTCLRFARKENSIILAISAANVDLANSDSLRFAEELDPEGKRTLCVITKLDLMDKGTTARDILIGKVLPKQLGYIGVVSRSQEDILKGKPIEESLDYEKQFFERTYPDIATKNGTLFLTRSLNMLLKKHIKKCLPNLKETIREKIQSAQYKLELLGPEIIDKRILIPEFLTRFSNAYRIINDGEFEENLNKIKGGAVISQIIYKQFPDNLMNIDIETCLTNDIIMTTIRNTCGSDKMSFSRQKAFICLIREQIQKLVNPSNNCIDDVYDIMQEFVQEASKAFPFFTFPHLMKEIVDETHTLIKKHYRITKGLVENLIKSEKTDIMCSHPNYKLGFVLQKMNFAEGEAENRINNDCAGNDKQEKDHLIEKFFTIICHNIQDNFQNFSKTMIFYLESANVSLQVLNLLQDKEIEPDQKGIILDELFDIAFHDYPEILENKVIIINAILNVDNKFFDDLLQYEFKKQLSKKEELTPRPNQDHECSILRALVIEYFNMVRQNICYYIPKLIKSFLVIHIKENLLKHLQNIYSHCDLESLLQESEDIHKQRKTTKELIEDLENVRKRIEDIYCDHR